MDWHGSPYRSRRTDVGTIELYRTIGTNIMACRNMRGFSTGDLAAVASIPEGVLAAYEAGMAHVPASDLVRIVEACDVTVSRMFSRVDMPSPRQAEAAHQEAARRHT